MAQAIVCYNQQGMVFATDSTLLQELADGRVARLSQRKLFALGERAAILTSGAAVGVDLSIKLSQWLQLRSLIDFEDVLTLSRDFLAEGYARYLRPGHGSPALPRHLYFIIGGYAPHPTSPPYRAVLLHSEAGELPFAETQLGWVFTLPRRVTLEGRMTRQVAEGVSLQALAESCRAGLASAAERNTEAVSGPFLVATVTAAGVSFLEDTQA